jgi:hypothetical protein
MRLGAHCSACHAGPTAILPVLGLTDLRAMVIVTATIALCGASRARERSASPPSEPERR